LVKSLLSYATKACIGDNFSRIRIGGQPWSQLYKDQDWRLIQSLFSYATKVSIGRSSTKIRIGDRSNLYLVMQLRRGLVTTFQVSGLVIGQIFI
jgi:hypothetical protein